MDAVSPPKPKVLVEAQPFIPYMKEENFDPRLKPVLDPYKKRMGFLPNALKLYAYRPEIAETLWALNSKVMRDPTSTLDQLLKRKLAAVACATNGCAYCTAHSCSMLKKPAQAGFEGWNMSEKELQDIITGDNEPANEMEKACFDYVRSASEDPTSVPDEILQRLKQHLTPPQIVELACVVGFWKFYNTVHDSLHIPVEVRAPGRYRVCQSLSSRRGRAGRGSRRWTPGRMPCRRRSSRAPLLEGRLGSALPRPGRRPLHHLRRAWRWCASISAAAWASAARNTASWWRSRIFRARDGISVGALAQALHVSSAFIATEDRQARPAQAVAQAHQSARSPRRVVERRAGRPARSRSRQRGNPHRQRSVLRRVGCGVVCGVERRGRRAGRKFGQGGAIHHLGERLAAVVAECG